MSEMEQAMNSAWLPSGRKFILPQLRQLTLRNVHFVPSRSGFDLGQLEVVTLGPFVYRHNENFHTSTHMLKLLLETSSLTRLNLVFDERDNWLEIRNFLESLQSGLCLPLGIDTASGRMTRENLVFLMLFLYSDDYLWDSITFKGLTIVEDGKVLGELNRTYSRDFPLDELLYYITDHS